MKRIALVPLALLLAAATIGAQGTPPATQNPPAAQAPATQPQRPPQPPLAPTQWRIDPSHSAANFSVRHNVVSTVRGQLGAISGVIEYDGKDINSVKADVAVDVAKINTQNERRDNHLRSPDFFDVANHPTMTFKSRRVEPGAAGRFKLIGDLTIRGNTKEVALDVEGPSPVMKSQRGVITGATATTKISRKEFGILWNNMIEAMPVVGDEVTITIDLELGSPGAAGRTVRAVIPAGDLLPADLVCAGALQSAAPSRRPRASAPPAPAAPPALSSYVPVRVFDTKAGAFVDFEVMLASVAKADVIFVGEQHDDPNTHRLEVAILEGLDRRKVRPVVSLEMFERDVQAVLDSYLSGALVEEEMVKTSRPWPRYATDYRPLIEAAKQRGWIVVAANVPRRIASAVAKSGQAAIAQLTESDRRLVARDLACPHDDYFKRFAATMTGHPGDSQTDRRETGDDGTVLLGAVRQGRDDGGVDCLGAREVCAGRAKAGGDGGTCRSLQRCVPQRLRSRHRRARPPPRPQRAECQSSRCSPSPISTP